MQVTPIFLTPPSGGKGHVTLTPELMAATFAKYSRSNQGIQAITGKINPANPEASIDAIFKFVDYGHASIGGMCAGVSMAIDNVSMWLAYKLFDLITMGDGQESSTRYILMNPSGAVNPEEVGMAPEFHARWNAVLQKSFEHYNHGIAAWTSLQQMTPAVTNIPVGANPKLVERLTKNFALDRARYFLAFGMRTNIALTASARIWVEAIRHLASLPQVEAQNLALLLRENLMLFAPRLTRHSTAEASYLAQGKHDLEMSLDDIVARIDTKPLTDQCIVSVLKPDTNPFFPPARPMAQAFDGKQNRYSRAGQYLRRMAVRFSWNNMATAEMRDLNRHRTGHRISLLSQRGLYYGPYWLGPTSYFHPEQELLTRAIQAKAQGFADEQASLLRDMALAGDPSYVYGLLLGSQSPFEHVTTADKFIYEVELRTGMGAHYRYAEHLALAAQGFFQQCPDAKPHVVLGDAEPE